MSNIIHTGQALVKITPGNIHVGPFESTDAANRWLVDRLQSNLDEGKSEDLDIFYLYNTKNETSQKQN